MILNDLSLETSCRFKLFKPDRQLYNLSNVNLELPDLNYSIQVGN